MSRERAINGLKWSLIERLLTQGTQFLLTILIARLLSPSDFGLIGMLSIFIAISQTFVDSGFTSALIRKCDRTEVDFSTAFYFNIAIGAFVYILLVLASPYIADFYRQPILIPLIYAMGINVLINSFSIVQRSKLIISLDFKTQAKAAVVGMMISGSVSIYMAYHNYGVWALVTQSILNNAITVLLIAYFTRWYPTERFCKASFFGLFNFGSKLLLSGLIDTVYRNIYQVIIGKNFNASTLGYYTQAQQLSELPATNFTSIIQRVSFPMLSEIQHDDNKLKLLYRKTLRLSAFILFPLMCSLSIMSDPIVRILLNDKWLPVIPLLSILCFGFMLYPIHSINLNLLQVKGRSDLFLKVEILKKILATVMIIVTTPFGLIPMCIGIVFTSYISWYINAYYTKKIIQFGFIQQIKNIFPMFFISFLTSFICYFIVAIIENEWGAIILTSVIGCFLYISLSSIFCKDEFLEIRKIVFKVLGKHK